MSFILSANRDQGSQEKLRADWDAYVAHLRALEDRFPKSAYAIATSSWWYEFDLPEAPHDSRLISFRMGDYGAADWDNHKLSWIAIELQSAYSGRILLRYPKVYRYNLGMDGDSQGIHGDWRYDEFTLTEDGHLLHTIEWADGAVWRIEASDLEHQHSAASNEANSQAQQVEDGDTSQRPC